MEVGSCGSQAIGDRLWAMDRPKARERQAIDSNRDEGDGGDKRRRWFGFYLKRLEPFNAGGRREKPEYGFNLKR